MSTADWNQASITALLFLVLLRMVAVGGYGRGAPDRMWATFWLPTIGMAVLVVRILVSRVTDVSPLSWVATIVFVAVALSQVPAIIVAWWPRRAALGADTNGPERSWENDHA